MDIRQIALGAGVAALLVLGADSHPAHPANVRLASLAVPVCDVDGLREAARDAAQRASGVVLDVVLDTAGELKARFKQVF